MSIADKMRKTVSDTKKPLAFNTSGHFTKNDWSNTGGNSSTLPQLGTLSTAADINSPIEVKPSHNIEEKVEIISPIKHSPTFN